MCGIAGLINPPFTFKEGIPLLEKSLAHRGPDGWGFFSDDNVCLVHTRLSIIDTSEDANQPLFNEDKSLVLVCNGEIYNYKQLRAELIAKGHRFSCQSDSEVILHLYEEYAPDLDAMLQRLRGMFAFALYDRLEGKLILARDRFGIKPLYYTKYESGIGFASEIRPLAVLPCFKTTIDYTSLFEYFQFLSIPEPNTIYEDIKSLPAGHYGIFSDGVLIVKEWYDLVEKVGNSHMSSNDAAAQLTSKLEETLSLHMVADVPVGAFLSAGIDSTLVTYYASRQTEIPFSCISAGFPGEVEDESAEASSTAQYLGLPFHSYALTNQFLGDATEITSFFDQPFGVASAFSLFRISKMARQHMKVVLTGDGGDEVFAGYDHKHTPFFVPPRLRILPLSLHPFFGSLLRWIPHNKLQALGNLLCLTSADKFLNRTRILEENTAFSLIHPDVRNRVDRHRLKRFIDAAFQRARRLDPIRQILYVDIVTFLKSEMLYKVDRMSMANGIEARVPLLDHELVELAFSLPIDQLRNDKYGKIALRQLVSEFLPDLAWRKKTGFNAPVYRWLQTDESETLEKIKNQTAVSFLSIDQVKTQIEHFQSGGQELGPLMIGIFSLIKWLKK